MASTSQLGDDTWHALAATEVLARLNSDRHRGLNSSQVESVRERFGLNALPSGRRESLGLRLAREFLNPLTGVLTLAVALTVYLGDYIDSVVIAVVIVINALIGFFQEYRAEKALEHVSKLLTPHATVIRDGVVADVAATELVPGDLIIIDAGSQVPADARLVLVESVEADESTLTGESTPVAKNLDTVDPDAALAERHNMVFAGTTVTRGSARAVVVATGVTTELGSIGQMMRRVGRLRTPLTRRLDRLAQQITLAVLLVAMATLAWGVLVRDLPFDFLFLAVVGLAVGAIPEGLPAVISFALASSARNLARVGVLVRRLPAVEALGSVTVVLTDKTGTLTKNEMTAVQLVTRDSVHEVTGVGYTPQGEVMGLPDDPDSDPWAAIRVFALCNDAHLDNGANGQQQSGDPTELALLTLAEKAGIAVAKLRDDSPRVEAIPFDADAQYMATKHQLAGSQLVAVKGSPEQVLQMCAGQLSDDDLAYWTQASNDSAAAGRRVLMAAVGESSRPLESLDTVPLRPVGMVSLMDPPQPEAIDALRESREAGVRVIMVTGDHPKTAEAIAAELGFPSPTSLIGSDIDALDDEALATRLRDVSVIARATPSHKLRLVTLLQEHGEFVAMTGDGVNDAPALRQAHIGVAMGRKGTDVAKEAADIVITDDRFATLEAAIREGRRVFDNIKKSLLFLLSTDLDEAILIMLAVLFGLSLPVTPTQILWVNLVTSVTLSFALVLEKPEPSVMRRGPNPKSLSLVTRAMLGRILLVSALSVVATFGVFWWQLGLGVALAEAQTAAVTMLVVIEVAILLNHRSFTRSALRPHSHQSNEVVLVVLALLALLQLGFVYLPIMNEVFGSVPLPWETWGIVLGLSAAVFALIEVEKLVRRKVLHQEVF